MPYNNIIFSYVDSVHILHIQSSLTHSNCLPISGVQYIAIAGIHEIHRHSFQSYLHSSLCSCYSINGIKISLVVPLQAQNFLHKLFSVHLTTKLFSYTVFMVGAYTIIVMTLYTKILSLSSYTDYTSV